jgi:hypothetical protein
MKPPRSYPRQSAFLLLVTVFAFLFNSHTPLAFAAPPESANSPLSIEQALAVARSFLAEREHEQERRIFGVQYIPSHGTARDYWLVELEPYPPSAPSPARPVSSLLISMDGQVRERGGRRAVQPEEREAIIQRTQSASETKLRKLPDGQQ